MNDDTRGYILDEAGEYSVPKKHFKLQSRTHRSLQTACSGFNCLYFLANGKLSNLCNLIGIFSDIVLNIRKLN